MRWIVGIILTIVLHSCKITEPQVHVKFDYVKCTSIDSVWRADHQHYIWFINFEGRDGVKYYTETFDPPIINVGQVFKVLK